MDDEQADVITPVREQKVVVVDMSRDGLHLVSIGPRPAAVREPGVLDPGTKGESAIE